ncbi:DUF3800 domain-containing protein [Streptantibioticus ferralitis]|uniref:DUF3800 domain-containing protein n=1 Tax=Streptantibioticus ferralitis TaxID=236510 RepID=A0ABT5YVH2_9ACTN|nr:DUF3800 domain-containing protein [Streptantibioticus ferralitis]MDF2254820.1 DUF3800 domain-containing protein [Streptantibioticus ferralitis]
MAARIFYIDDSGAESTGYVVYGWAEVDIAQWSKALRRWLDFRKRLYTDAGIPADYELHATQFIPGRGEPSGNRAWDRRKKNRAQVAQNALATIAAMPGTFAGAVYRHTPKRGRAYHGERAAVYEALLADLDARLGATGDHGVIVMDGDGSDPTYQREHRKLKLATRHIVEDPWFLGSNTSQPVQAADLLAYTAYQAVQRHEGKRFMWDWWARLLPAADPPRKI